MKFEKAGTLAAAMLLSAGALHAETAVERHYKHIIGASAFTANNLYLQTGWYGMDGGNVGNDIDLDNANFVGSYYFGSIGDEWRPFVLGGFGFSNIDQDGVTVDGASVDNVGFDSSYFKIGAGINYNPTSTVSMVLGASGMWMSSDSDFLNVAGAPTAGMLRYFYQDSDTSLYDIFGRVNFHTEIDGYKPYAEITLHYINIDYDYGLSDESGWNADLSAGVFTPTLTHWLNLPVRAQFFAAANLLDGDLSDVAGFDSALSAGASLLWKIGPAIPVFGDAFHETELAFNLQGTAGDNDFSGFKASVSFSIAKF
jgi:hypothetical protein